MTGENDSPDPPRRDFVITTALAFAGLGGALALWPFIDQGNPNAGTKRPDRVDVDLAAIVPGQTVRVAWRGMPLCIRHRPAEEVAAMQAVGLAGLRDTAARNDALGADAPALDSNRTVAGMARWLVVVGACTRNGCILTPRTPAEARDDGGAAFICPCDACRYDASGRIVAGPAPTNLQIPRYTFPTPATLRLG